MLETLASGMLPTVSSVLLCKSILSASLSAPSLGTNHEFSVIICGLYYVFWMHLLPKWKGYQIRTEITNVDDNGANTHRLVRIPNAEVAKWDEEHDEAGNLRQRRVTSSGDSGKE